MDKTRFNGSEIHYVPPTQFNTGYHGMLWPVETENKEIIYYIQTSEDKENPEWKRMGEVMEKGFVKLFSDQLFLDQCLKMYRTDFTDPWYELRLAMNVFRP